VVTPANDLADRYAYALALRQAGRYDEAQQQMTRLLKSDPDRLTFRLEAAEIALAKGDRDAGVAAVRGGASVVSRRLHSGDELWARAGHPGRSKTGAEIIATAPAPPT
jgi:tetratricopeptide (TPR) repeat protein